MKRLLPFVFLLLFVSCAHAALTVGKVPVTRTGGTTPDLQDSDITDSLHSNVTIAVPVNVSGTVTATSFNGNATSATTLANTPSQCNAGNYPLGVDAQGNASSCTAITNSGTVTSIATSAPLTGGPISTTGTIAIPKSTTGVDGYLASADFTTFNNKQASLGLVAGTYVNGDVCTYSSSGTLINCNTSPSGSGTVTSIGVGSSANTLTVTNTPVTGAGTINADINFSSINGINSTALVQPGAIHWASFPSVGFAKWNGSGTPTADTNTYLTGNQSITLSGDISGSGATTITTAIGASKVTNAMLAGSIAASKLVGTDITTLGTISAGIWNGTVIPIAYGGTGLSSATDDALMVGNGSLWQSKLLSDCQDSGGNHLNYNASTNAFSCGTSSSVSAAAGSLTGTTLASNVVNSSLTGLGTITSGTWNGTTIDASHGGTGITSFADDTVPVGTGIGYAATSLANCTGANKALTYDTSTNTFSCNTISSTGTPAGSSGTLQYNNTGSFGAASGSSVSNTFNQSSGSATQLTIAPTISQTGTAAYTVFTINPSLTSTGSGNHLLTDWQASGVSVAKVDQTGTFSAASYITVSTSAGEVDLYQPSANGASFFAWKAPTTMTSSVTVTVPTGYGLNNQVLTSNGTGSSSWVRPGTAKTTTTSTTSWTINSDATDIAIQTALAGDITINAPTGAPVDGQTLLIRITGTGARAITWNSIFAASSDLSLPTTTTTTKTLYTKFIYNETAVKWQLLAKLDNFT